MWPFRRRRPALTAAGAVRLAATGGVVLVDVREPDEIALSGKAAGALEIPLGRIAALGDPRAPGFEPRLGQGRPIAVYCAAGIRSGKAAAMLRSFGLEAHNIGSLDDWTRAGGAAD